MSSLKAISLPPSGARVVIIGGGISGCSVAYHLAKLGWKDIILLERKQLTCGTTWHAAGLIGQLRASLNMTRLAKYSAELYIRLEQETGIATGMKQNGSITMALSEARKEEILRQATMAKAFGVEVHPITPDELAKLYPWVSRNQLTQAIYIPKDGQCDPANIAMALAKGARQNGAKLLEEVKVTKIQQMNGRVTGVDWLANDGAVGHTRADIVVNCAGMWGRELAAEAGVTLPLHACEHFYLISEPVAGLSTLPVLRVPDECAYYKEDAGKMMVGAFEPKAKPWGMDGISEDFCFDTLPDDYDHFEPILTQAMARMPLFQNHGIHSFFNGPESFTPDDRYYLGEAPALKGYWIAAGYNSVGIAGSGGAGMALAQWLDQGYPPFDLWEVDIRRAHPFQRNRLYLQARVSETLGLLYADHFPHRQAVTARGVRRSPLHQHLAAARAVFGEVAGYERANWYAKPDQVAEYRYDWQESYWFANQREEHLALRHGVGLIDMSSFGKILIEGRDALALMDRLCANQIDVGIGRIVYSQMLNARGGIESDVTITRLSPCKFLMVTPIACLQRDLAWLRNHCHSDEFVTITDISASEAVIVLMGPKSRELLQAVSPSNLSNQAFPYGTAQEIEIGMGLARAHRISYVGELGYELYCPSDFSAHIFETLQEAGQAISLKLCGIHAMDGCRIEKAYRHFGHDITDEDHVLEAGLGFAVKLAKPEFIGRQAVITKQAQGLSRRLVQFLLSDPEARLYHNEGIIRDGRMVGVISSGNYGHALGGAVGLGYVPCKVGEVDSAILGSHYEIEIAGRRYPAKASLSPLYDPKGARLRM